MKTCAVACKLLTIMLALILPLADARADLIDDHMKLMVKAIGQGDARLVERLLTTPYVDVNSKIDSRVIPGNNYGGAGQPYIGFASYICKASVVDVLIKAGADIDAANNGGITSVYQAAAQANGSVQDCLDTLKTLLNANARVDKISINGYLSGSTPLEYVANFCGRPGSAERLSLLRRYGADLNRVWSKQGYTPALLIMISSETQDGCVEVARQLTRPDLPGRVDLEIKDVTGFRPVDLASPNCLFIKDKDSKIKIRAQIQQIYIDAGSKPPVPMSTQDCLRFVRGGN